MAKRIRQFGYRLGEITDGNNRPVFDRAFIEIVDADDPQVLLGEINVEIENADMHARKIIAALSAKPLGENEPNSVQQVLCPKCFGTLALVKDQIGNDVPAPTSWLDVGTGSVRPIGSMACDRCNGSGIVVVHNPAGF